MAGWLLADGADGADGGGERARSVSEDAADRLTGRELLVLQLVARGYSREQVADLIGGDEGDVVDALAGAVGALGAAGATEAIAAARARELIR